MNTEQASKTIGAGAEYEYDAGGRRTAVILPAVTDPANPTELVRPKVLYEYSASGELLSVTDAMGHVTTYRYDDSGIRISQEITGWRNGVGYRNRGGLHAALESGG